ncbi:MAG: PqqD family protein [Casimicrobiaceae bacterium]
MAHCYEINAPTAVGEIVDGEVMVMNLRDGIYYSIAGAGAAIWPALVGGSAIDSIASAVCTASDAPLATVITDLEAFTTRLVGEAILRASTATPSQHALQLVDFGNYCGFDFERFDDMRAMLILDPVHEVGDFGWPQQGVAKQE